MAESLLRSQRWATIKNVLQRHSARYVLVGGMVYVLELIIIIIAQNMGASAVVAVALSFTIGLIVSFFLQKLLSFGDRRMHHKIIVPQAMAVGLLVVWNFCFTLGMTRLLEDLLSPTITRTIALAITTIWNYYLYKTRIFYIPDEQK